jgi:hypothetical protein
LGALVAHPMKNYFEKNGKENFESTDSKFHSHRESGFKNSMISSIALAKLKIEDIEDFRKSKVEEIEV